MQDAHASVKVFQLAGGGMRSAHTRLGRSRGDGRVQIGDRVCGCKRVCCLGVKYRYIGLGLIKGKQVFRSDEGCCTCSR